MKKQCKSFSKVVYVLTAVALVLTAIAYAGVTWDYNPVSSGDTLSAATLNELYNNTKYLTDVFEVKNGNVGIGTVTPSPSYKLDVNGNMRANSIASATTIINSWTLFEATTHTGSSGRTCNDICDDVYATGSCVAGAEYNGLKLACSATSKKYNDVYCLCAKR